MTTTRHPLVLITGASRGLGAAIAHDLAADGWTLILTARGRIALDIVARDLRSRFHAHVVSLPGDVTDARHRERLAVAIGDHGGRLTALVNNASDLGPSPLPAVTAIGAEALTRLLAVNVVAPAALTGRLLPALDAAEGAVVNVSSDAATEHWSGWGPYGASKAALDHLSAVMAAEHPALSIYAVDPGDMRTQMHQDAFPGEDISDRPPASSVSPALVRLLRERPPSGRYRAQDLDAESLEVAP